MIHVKASSLAVISIGVLPKTIRMKAIAWVGLFAGLLGAGSSHSQTIDPLTHPTGAHVVAGKATARTEIERWVFTNKNGTFTWLVSASTDVRQSTERAVINWRGFSVGRETTVNFHQPSSSSVTLNRVTGAGRSIIEGAINATGQVYLINPHGILFGKSARVNVGGLVASTLDMSNADFMAGTGNVDHARINFSGDGRQGRVDNQGTLTATKGGYIFLAGKQVVNEGEITANSGIVSMVAADSMVIRYIDKSLWGAFASRPTLQALVHNKGAVIADGGAIYLNAHGADAVMATVVKNTGLLRARSIDNKRGSINLSVDLDDRLEMGGTLDVNTAQQGVRSGWVRRWGGHHVVARDAIQGSSSESIYAPKGERIVDRIEP
jgi:filamentous hemagglutinin family protein